MGVWEIQEMKKKRERYIKEATKTHLEGGKEVAIEKGRNERWLTHGLFSNRPIISQQCLPCQAFKTEGGLGIQTKAKRIKVLSSIAQYFESNLTPQPSQEAPDPFSFEWSVDST